VYLPEDYVTEEVIRRFCYGCSDKESAQYASDRCPTSLDEALRLVKTHLQNTKAIYGGRKTVRQISCPNCEPCGESRTIRSICGGQHSGCRFDSSVCGNYDSHSDPTGCQSTVCSVSCQQPKSVLSSNNTEEVLQVRKLNPGNYGNKPSHNVGFEQRLDKLEELCGRNFEKLFKLLEDNKPSYRNLSPRRSGPLSPGRGCFGCGGSGHFIANCPQAKNPNQQVNKSPSPAKQSIGGNSGNKVTFSSPLNRPGLSA